MFGTDDQAEIDIYGSFGYHLGVLVQLGDAPEALLQLQATLAGLGALHYQALQAGSQYHLAYAALHSSARPTVAQHELSKLLDATFWAVARDRWTSPEWLENN